MAEVARVKVVATKAEMTARYSRIHTMDIRTKCPYCPVLILLDRNIRNTTMPTKLYLHIAKEHVGEDKPKRLKIECPFFCGEFQQCSLNSSGTVDLFPFKRHVVTQVHASDWGSAAGLTVLRRIADMPNMFKDWFPEADADNPKHDGRVVIFVTDGAIFGYKSQSTKLITFYMRYADRSISKRITKSPHDLFSTPNNEDYLPEGLKLAEDSLVMHRNDPKKFYKLYNSDGEPLASYLLWEEARLRAIALNDNEPIVGAQCLVCLCDITACPDGITTHNGGYCNGPCRISGGTAVSGTYCLQAFLDAQGAKFSVRSEDGRDASQLRPNSHEKCTFTCLDCQCTFKRIPHNQTRQNSACPGCKSPNVAESAINKFLVLLNNGWTPNNGYLTFIWIKPLKFDHYNDILRIIAETHSRLCHSKIEETMNDIKKMLGALNNNKSYIFWDVAAYFAPLRTLQNLYKAIVYAHKVIADYRANNQDKNCVVYIPPPGPRFAGYETQCQAARDAGYEVIVIELGCNAASQVYVSNGDRMQTLIDDFYGKAPVRARDDDDEEDGEDCDESRGEDADADEDVSGDNAASEDDAASEDAADAPAKDDASDDEVIMPCKKARVSDDAAACRSRLLAHLAEIFSDDF